MCKVAYDYHNVYIRCVMYNHDEDTVLKYFIVGHKFLEP